MFRRLQAIAARDLHAVLGRISWRRHIAPILFGCAVLALMIQLDAFEKFTAFSHEHEDWQLDEFLTSFAVFGAVAMWFVRVRSKELEREATRRAEAEQCLETALHTMHHGISMFDADQRLVICNSRYGEVYDLPPASPGRARRSRRSWNSAGRMRRPASRRRKTIIASSSPI